MSGRPTLRLSVQRRLSRQEGQGQLRLQDGDAEGVFLYSIGRIVTVHMTCT